ncbi:MAG: lipoyl synthase [Phycisphaerales bacterium]|nr:lipoyl synthase [Phycisphaerales bacterium]
MSKSPGLKSVTQRHPRPLGGDTARGHRQEAIFSLSDQVLSNTAQQSLLHGRKPSWIRAPMPGGDAYLRTKETIEANQLHTVCQEASCPNIGECWARGTATIMILGDVCTRSCGFCNVKTGRPPMTDLDEPRRVANALSGTDLQHIVITSVDRDDLPDGGAAIWAETIERVHHACPGMTVEVLTGDFQGDLDALQLVMDAKPEILAHNVETVPRMHPAVRPQARYERSLQVLTHIHEGGLVAKTSLMVGIGERDDELEATIHDIADVSSTDILTIGQYLQPTRNHLPIHRWVPPSTFDHWKQVGLHAGFRVVESGPLVRSSYHADAQARLAEVSTGLAGPPTSMPN